MSVTVQLDAYGALRLVDAAIRAKADPAGPGWTRDDTDRAVAEGQRRFLSGPPGRAAGMPVKVQVSALSGIIRPPAPPPAPVAPPPPPQPAPMPQPKGLTEADDSAKTALIAYMDELDQLHDMPPGPERETVEQRADALWSMIHGGSAEDDAGPAPGPHEGEEAPSPQLKHALSNLPGHVTSYFFFATDAAGAPDTQSGDNGEWTVYTGPRGGKGWRKGDRIVYTSSPTAPGHKRRQREQSGRRAQGISERVLSHYQNPHEEAAPSQEELQELATHLPKLSREQLRGVRNQLLASFGGGKRREEMAHALRKHVDDLVTTRQKTEGRLFPEYEGRDAEAEKAQAAAAEKRAARPKPGADAGPLRMMKTGDIHVDPERFQFKQNLDQKGVSDELKGVKTFNPDLAGVVSTWDDPADGKTYVVNGHHRHELAVRTGHPELATRKINAKDAVEARSKGALINMAEGRGTALDAAKFLRDRDLGPEDLEKEGISLKGAVARDAGHLKNLSDPLFHKAARGQMDMDRAVQLGQHLPGKPDLQNQLHNYIEKREAATGREWTPKMVAEAAREMMHAPTSQGEGGGLFDDAQEESRLEERAALKAHVRAALTQQKNDFQVVGSERRAGNVAGAGNTLNVEENKKLAKGHAVNEELFDKFANKKGPLADLIIQAAEEYADAPKGKRDEIKRQLVKQSTDLLQSGVAGLAGGGGAGPAPDGAHPGGGPGGGDGVRQPEPGADAAGGPDPGGVQQPEPGGAAGGRADRGGVQPRGPERPAGGGPGPRDGVLTPEEKDAAMAADADARDKAGALGAANDKPQPFPDDDLESVKKERIAAARQADDLPSISREKTAGRRLDAESGGSVSAPTTAADKPKAAPAAAPAAAPTPAEAMRALDESHAEGEMTADTAARHHAAAADLIRDHLEPLGKADLHQAITDAGIDGTKPGHTKAAMLARVKGRLTARARAFGRNDKASFASPSQAPEVPIAHPDQAAAGPAGGDVAPARQADAPAAEPAKEEGQQREAVSEPQAPPQAAAPAAEPAAPAQARPAEAAPPPVTPPAGYEPVGADVSDEEYDRMAAEASAKAKAGAEKIYQGRKAGKKESTSADAPTDTTPPAAAPAAGPADAPAAAEPTPAAPTPPAAKPAAPTDPASGATYHPNAAKAFAQQLHAHFIGQQDDTNKAGGAGHAAGYVSALAAINKLPPEVRDAALAHAKELSGFDHAAADKGPPAGGGLHKVRWVGGKTPPAGADALKAAGFHHEPSLREWYGTDEARKALGDLPAGAGHSEMGKGQWPTMHANAEKAFAGRPTKKTVDSPPAAPTMPERGQPTTQPEAGGGDMGRATKADPAAVGKAYGDWYGQAGATAGSKSEAAHAAERERHRAALAGLGKADLVNLGREHGYHANPADPKQKVVDGLIERADDRRGSTTRRGLIDRPAGAAAPPPAADEPAPNFWGDDADHIAGGGSLTPEDADRIGKNLDAMKDADVRAFAKRIGRTDAADPKVLPSVARGLIRQELSALGNKATAGGDAGGALFGTSEDQQGGGLFGGTEGAAYEPTGASDRPARMPNTQTEADQIYRGLFGMGHADLRSFARTMGVDPAAHDSSMGISQAIKAKMDEHLKGGGTPPKAPAPGSGARLAAENRKLARERLEALPPGQLYQELADLGLAGLHPGMSRTELLRLAEEHRGRAGR